MAAKLLNLNFTVTFLVAALGVAALGCAADESSNQPSQAPPRTESEAWQKAKSLNTFDAVVNFVKEHPGSQFVKEAQSTWGRPGKKQYEPKSMTAALYLENDSAGPYAIVEVGGRPSEQDDEREEVPLEEGLFMLQTKENPDVWYEIVASDRVGKDIRVVTENLHVYLIYGLSFNFTGHIKPL